MDEEEAEAIYDYNEIQLYPEMNEKIIGLLKMRDNDCISLYAAKLIEYLKKGIN